MNDGIYIYSIESNVSQADGQRERQYQQHVKEDSPFYPLYSFLFNYSLRYVQLLDFYFLFTHLDKVFQTIHHFFFLYFVVSRSPLTLRAAFLRF